MPKFVRKCGNGTEPVDSGITEVPAKSCISLPGLKATKKQNSCCQ